MINNDIIKEHPKNELVLWVSNAVIEPKPNGSFVNGPLPWHKDILAKLAGYKIFLKNEV